MQSSVLLCYISCILIAFIIGYNQSIFNNPSYVVKDEINQSDTNSSNFLSDADSINTLWSMSVAFWSLGGFASSFLVFRLICSPSRIGCKKAIYLSSAISSIGLLIQFQLLYLTEVPWILAVGRLILGLGDGIILFAAEVFLESVCPPSKRNTVNGVFSVAFLTGVFVTETLGFQELLGDRGRFHFLYFIPLCGYILAAGCIYRSYDNPSDIADRNSDRAQWILSQFYDDDVTDYEELDPLIQSLMTFVTVPESPPAETSFRTSYEFSTGSRRRELISNLSLIALVLFEKCSGSYILFLYSFDLLRQQNVNRLDAQVATASCALVAIIFTIVTTLHQKFNCFPIYWIIIGCLGMMCGTITLEVLCSPLVSLNDHRSRLSLSCSGLFLFFLFYSIGPRMIVESMKAERIPFRMKMRRFVLIKKTEWLTLFVASITYPILQQKLDYCFFILFIGSQIALMLSWIHRQKFVLSSS